jgi:hypothetical protein
LSAHVIALADIRQEQRKTFFATLIEHIQRPPSLFPDGMPRKRRVLEVLPQAAPLPPKAPSAAVVAAQKARDEAVRDILVLRLQGILTDLVKKYRKFSFPAAVSVGCGMRESPLMLGSRCSRKIISVKWMC